MLQLSGNSVPSGSRTSLLDLRRGDAAILDFIDLPGDEARRLMELGFLPGARITAGFARPRRRPAGIPGGRFGNRAAARNCQAAEDAPARAQAGGQERSSVSDCGSCHGCGTTASSCRFACSRRNARPPSEIHCAGRPAELGQVHSLQSSHGTAPESGQFSRRNRGAAHRRRRTPRWPNRAGYRPAGHLQSFAALGRRTGGPRRSHRHARRTRRSRKPSCWCSIPPTWAVISCWPRPSWRWAFPRW